MNRNDEESKLDLLTLNLDELNKRTTNKKDKKPKQENKVVNKEVSKEVSKVVNKEVNKEVSKEVSKVVSKEVKMEVTPPTIENKQNVIPILNKINPANSLFGLNSTKANPPQIEKDKLFSAKPFGFNTNSNANSNSNSNEGSLLSKINNTKIPNPQNTIPISNSIPVSKIDDKTEIKTTPTNKETTPTNKETTQTNKETTPTNKVTILQNVESKTVPPTNTYQLKLLTASSNYWEKRSTRIEFTKNPKYKKQIDKIMTEIINPTIDQISSEGDLPDKVKKINSLLKELYDNKLYELYDFSLNLICQKIISKSENYLKDRKTLLIFAKFIFFIRKSFKLIEDFFFMILAYKCPYIIPKVYSKKDFPDKETYMKRLGYSNSEEPITTWMSNMECYSYLFFAYLGLDENLLPLIQEYVINLERLPVDYPLSTTFKTFLNTLGGKFKTKISEGNVVLKRLVAKYVKELEDLKTKSKSSELKSITADNIHFIKKYFQTSDFKFN